AERMACRLQRMYDSDPYGKFKHLAKYLEVVKFDHRAGKYNKWNGKTYCDESALEKPLHWKKPRRIFVCSMGDIALTPYQFFVKIMITIKDCPQHTFMFLTKRPEQLLKLCRGLYEHGSPPGNLWIGVTAENQEQADKRIPILLQIPAVVRFVSIEPMLSEINLEKYLHCGISWCIIGAESGKNARFMNENWVRSLICQCKKNQTAVFYKQKRVGNKMIKMPEIDGKVYAD
ncbi:hypothetical protein LCGC14_1606210, partial [marine sediment metagenome]|nr:DUF5131 family protein [Methylophaga sp.]